MPKLSAVILLAVLPCLVVVSPASAVIGAKTTTAAAHGDQPSASEAESPQIRRILRKGNRDIPCADATWPFFPQHCLTRGETSVDSGVRPSEPR